MLDYLSFQKKYRKRLWYFQRKRVERLLKEENVQFHLVKTNIYQQYPILFSSWRYYPLSEKKDSVYLKSFIFRIFISSLLILLLIKIQSVLPYNRIYLFLYPVFYFCFMHVPYSTMQSTMAFYLAYKASFLYPYKRKPEIYLDKIGYGLLTLIILPKKYAYMKKELENRYPAYKMMILTDDREDIFLCDGFLDRNNQFYCQYVNTYEDHIVLKENVDKIQDILDFLIQRIHMSVTE